ncbi:hypothetical protein BJ742DRAFT_854067 [Cladochytrium replicatum]|nr:hypothetical protein BJ742DRAFT_854067 [Cladochytrium replicatum]
MQSSSSDVSAMDCNEFVQPGITETTPKSAPGELLTTSGPISIMSMLDQLSNRIKEPRMEWITREDGMLVCTLCTGKDHREYKERDALRKHCRASHPAKEGLGTNPRVHTEEFLRDAFEVAGLPAAGQEGVDMVLRILQGTVKRDKNSLNNDSYEEDLANVRVAPLHNENPVNNPLIQSAIATGNLRRIALDFFIAEEFGVLVCISCGILVDASSCGAHVQKYHSQVDRSTRLIASRALLNLNVVNQLTPLWNNKVILERIDRDNNKLASFTPIPGVCHCCKSNPAARGTSPKQVKVQSIVMPYYGLHGYWVVQMAPLGPYSPDPSLQLTEMQKASLQLLLADAFTSVPALKLSEELPPWILGCDFHHVDPRHRSGQKINERITWKDVVGEQNQDIGLGFNRKELGKTMVAYHKALQSRIMRMPFMVRQEIMKPRFDQEQQVNEKQNFLTASGRNTVTLCTDMDLCSVADDLGVEAHYRDTLCADQQLIGSIFGAVCKNVEAEGDQGLDVAQLLSGDTNHEDEVDSEESSSESGDEDQESPVGPTHLLPVGSAAETEEELFAALLAVTESLFQAETVISTIPEKVFNNPLFTWWVIDSRCAGGLETCQQRVQNRSCITQMGPALGGILASWVRNIGPVTDHHDLWQQHGQLLEWNKKIAAAVLLGCGAPPRLTDLVAQNAVNSSAVPRSVYHKNDRLVLVSYRCKTEQIKEERTVVPRFVPRSLERLLIFHLFIVRRLLFSTFKWVQKKTFPEECRRSLFLGKNGTLECSDLSTTLTETFQSVLGVRVTYAEYRRFASNFSQIDSRLMPAQVSTLLRKGDMANLGEGHSSHTAEAIYNRTGSSNPSASGCSCSGAAEDM